MLIAIPTGVKIFNWIGTMWGGSLNMRVPLYWAVGFVAMFIIGGLSGVMHASPPVDWQQTDTYFVVAHFHYVLFGGSIMAIFGGIYYWWPKFTGRMLDERLGKIHFWLTLVGFNVTFFPMHLLGLWGMPRRIYTYPSGMGWDEWNLLITVGAFFIAFATVIFLVNAFTSLRNGKPAGDDPWDGGTLEWATSSPPPPYNFATIPMVRARDPFWAVKRGDQHGHAAPHPVRGGSEAAHADGHQEEHIHLPNPSYFPLVAAIGIFLFAAGFVYIGWALTIVGLVVLLVGIYGWAMEPAS
jgi:cytochrome c oxidase subunit 1